MMKNKNSVKTFVCFLTLFLISTVFPQEAGAETGRHIYTEYKTGTYYTDSAHWECRNGRWMCADNDYHQAYYNAWVCTDGKWYYIDKNGYMVTDAWVDDYYVDHDGVMKTGWVNDGEDKWFYFYSDGTKAVNTTIDGCILGVDGKWDKNPEFTQEIAVNFAKQKYNDDSIEAICGGSFDYRNGRKYYYVHLATKGIQESGSTGTIGNCMVFGDGTVEVI